MEFEIICFTVTGFYVLQGFFGDLENNINSRSPKVILLASDAKHFYNFDKRDFHKYELFYIGFISLFSSTACV